MIKDKERYRADGNLDRQQTEHTPHIFFDADLYII